MEKTVFKKKEKKITPRVSAHLYLKDIDDRSFDGVAKLISTEIPFKNISLPVHVPKELLSSGEAGTTVIGYIESLNNESGMFSVVVFDKFESAIKSLGDLDMHVIVKNYKGELTITKFVINPTEHN